MDVVVYFFALVAYGIAVASLGRVRRLEADVSRLNEKAGLVSESASTTLRPYPRWIFVLAFVLGLVLSIAFFAFMLFKDPLPQ